MQVIKLGGSLANTTTLPGCLDSIEQYSQEPTVIVPGGGSFADQVRLAQQQWRFSDHIAHGMAILAMQQMALLFHGLNPGLPVAGSAEEIKQGLQKNRVIIWSPDMHWINAADIPATWDITSDSLSAWLAAKLSASKLVLVKSASIATNFTFTQLAEQGIVDKAFGEMTENAAYAIKILNQDELSEYLIQVNIC